MISNHCIVYIIIIIIVNSIFCSRDHFSIIAKNFCEADLLYFQIILGVQVLSMISLLSELIKRLF